MIDLTPALRLYARCRLWRLDAAPAAESQAKVLLRLCRRARETRFGRDHGLGAVGSVEEFQRRIPLRDYGAFWAEYWQPSFPVLRDITWPSTIPYFAKTSGTTTGATKYIPYTREMARDAYLNMLELFAHHLHAHPGSRLLGGKGLMLSGEIARPRHPFRRGQRHRRAPGAALFAAEGAALARDRRHPRLIREDRPVGGGLARAGRAHPRRLAELAAAVPRPVGAADARGAAAARQLVPEAGVIVHGGVNFAPYRSRFRALLEGSRAETREAYSASEGFFAAADRGDGEGMRLIADRGIFYEFVPVEEIDAPNPTRHWAATVQPGVDYALYVSTCAGAWAYGLGDTVRLVDTEPMRLVVTGRTSYPGLFIRVADLVCGHGSSC